MRRLIVLAILLLLVAPASAQVSMHTYPSGILDYNNTSVSISNSSTATTIYTKNIPARVVTQFSSPNFGAYALHLKLVGTITSSLAPGAVNLGCNFGGANASLALINGSTPTSSLSAAPFELDLYVRRLPNAAAEFLLGRVAIQTATTTLLPYASVVYGTVSTASNQTLACTWQWGSASTGNALVIYNAVLEEGA